jgi:hypothetical protein
VPGPAEPVSRASRTMRAYTHAEHESRQPSGIRAALSSGCEAAVEVIVTFEVEGGVRAGVRARRCFARSVHLAVPVRLVPL